MTTPQRKSRAERKAKGLKTPYTFGIYPELHEIAEIQARDEFRLRTGIKTNMSAYIERLIEDSLADSTHPKVRRLYLQYRKRIDIDKSRVE